MGTIHVEKVESWNGAAEILLGVSLPEDVVVEIGEGEEERRRTLVVSFP